MRPNLAIGEAVIHAGDSEWMLRPSFANSQRLIDWGYNPSQMFAAINSDLQTVDDPVFKSGFAVGDAITVLQAYSEPEISEEVVGWYQPGKVRQGIKYRPGAMHWEDMLVMAHHCLRYALIGKPSRKPKQDGEAGVFDPTEFVGLITAHLGSSRSDAWGMTMIEFQRAWDAKYPTKEAEKTSKAKRYRMPQERIESLRDRAHKAIARLREQQNDA